MDECMNDGECRRHRARWEERLRRSCVGARAILLHSLTHQLRFLTPIRYSARLRLALSTQSWTTDDARLPLSHVTSRTERRTLASHESRVSEPTPTTMASQGCKNCVLPHGL